jgi:hypothetical protein
MKYGAYKTNAFKTLQPKAAKLGLRVLSKNTLHVNQSKAILGLNVAVGELTSAVTPYLLGAQLKPELKTAAVGPLGAIGFNVVLLARLTKVKSPSAKKKIKLKKGTYLEAYITLVQASNALLNYVDGVFLGPAMRTVTKEVTNPGTGEKSMREVLAIDVDQENLNEQERQKQVAAMVENLTTAFWAFAYAYTDQTPMEIFEEHMPKLIQAYPGIAFVEDTETETEPVEEEVVTAV